MPHPLPKIPTGISGFDEVSHGGLPHQRTTLLKANAATFDWGLPALMKGKLFFLDARLSPEVVHAGEFDLSGMLAMLKAKKDREKELRRIRNADPARGNGRGNGESARGAA